MFVQYFLAALLFISFSSVSYALTPQEILFANTRAIVFLQSEDGEGKIRDSGTGFIISQDGYVVTAAHLFPEGATKLWATIGQRQGSKYLLEPREANTDKDVALWQLPQSPTCRYSAIISSGQVNVFDRVLAIGFPGEAGLTPSTLNIANLSTPAGMYRSDGYLQPGNSGGPVFNESGHVVAIVQGGTIGGVQANDLIPISLAVDLIRRRRASFSPGQAETFQTSCYSFCRHSNHGIEGWQVSRPWPGTESPDGKSWSGWLGGGNGQHGVCGNMIASYLVSHRDATIEIGQTGEISRRDVFGHVQYKYWCNGTFRQGPIFRRAQSESCGLWE